MSDASKDPRFRMKTADAAFTNEDVKAVMQMTPEEIKHNAEAAEILREIVRDSNPLVASDLEVAVLISVKSSKAAGDWFQRDQARGGGHG